MFTGLKNMLVKTWNNSNPSEIPTESQFFEKGILIPEEFTQAGDRLILSNPIWSWKRAEEGGNEEKCLEPDKQFLSAMVISRQRLKDITEIVKEAEMDIKGWTSLQIQDKPRKEVSEQEIADLEVIDDEVKFEVEDEEDEIEKRIYTVNITYDRYYLTPRFWLSGVDYQNKPLTKEMIYEEVIGDYKDKTVTYDRQPHRKIDMVNIHPCQHAAVLRDLANRARANGNDIQPDLCLFIFLKFITSVMPGLEIDFTTDIEL